MADRSAFDLFAGLAALSKGDKDWYDNLSLEGQKAAAPFVMMRWMCGTSDGAQIVRINSLVNTQVFNGVSSKSTLFKLLAIAATGKSSRYSWLKGPGSKAKKLSLEVLKQYYECSTREAITYKVDAETLLEMAEELGWDKEELTKLTKELDDGSGTAKAESSKPSKPRRGK
jgi:hypothetical protein